ncbi:hypothetical protein FKP32DRAFT_1042591 [Trametes sanguinea]|nr:hypothetical protein FKP32DRAFT_1042591 [Trametes sanguinea]
MHILDINDDVLLYTATQSLTRTDRSLLSRTCHRFHHLLSPTLLRKSVWLHESNLASFASFVQAGYLRDAAFCRPLRSIDFNILPLSLPREEAILLLSRILQCTHHLIKLVLHRIVHTFTPECLRNILAAVPTVQELTLRDLDHEYSHVLADACPELKTIVLELVADEMSRKIHRHSPVDPRPFLQSHSLNITKLVLSQISLHASGTPFPGVVDLYITDYGASDADSGLTGPLVHLFPNVERARLMSLQTSFGTITPSLLHSNSLQDANALRRASMRWQATHGTWAKGLHLLEIGSLVDLYCLGLRCHIARVNIWMAFDPIGIAKTALADVRPRCLQFPVSGLREMPKIVPHLLVAISQTRSLDRLIVDVSITFPRQALLPSLLSQLGDSLRGTCITHLLVHVDAYTHLGEYFPHPPTECQSGIDALLVLTDGNRALHRVFLDFKGHYLRTWERNMANGAGDLWEEVPESSARRILVAEDMLL